MFLLLVSGTLCIYRVDRDTAILEKLQYPSMIKDSEGKQLTSQQITAMSFVSTRPPKYDCEIFVDTQKKRKKDENLPPPEISARSGVTAASESFIIFVSFNN